MESKKYLESRDAYRALDTMYPRPPRWTEVNPKLMAKMWGLPKAKTEVIGRLVKSAWDWNCTGSNRRKGNLNADSRCQLCGNFETQEHIVAYCKHPDVFKLRKEFMDDIRDDITLLNKGTVLDIAWTIFHLAEDKKFFTDLCTGLFAPETYEVLGGTLPNITITLSEWRQVEKLQNKFGKFGQDIIKLHGNLTANLLTGKTGAKTGLIKCGVGPQRSIQAAFSWQNSSHKIFCQPISSPTTNIWCKSMDEEGNKKVVNIHEMIRWHRAVPLVVPGREIITRVKRKYMGKKMKELHDLTHRSKVVIHKFERRSFTEVQETGAIPQVTMGTTDHTCTSEYCGIDLAEPALLEDVEEEECVVKRRRIARNVILDDEECKTILSRTHYGLWKPNKRWNEHKRANMEFIRKMNRKTTDVSTDGMKEPALEIPEPEVPEDKAPILCSWGKFVPMKFDLAGNTVPAHTKK